MVKLIINEAAGGTRDIALGNERTSIGRHTSNDICLNDKAVSGNHAAVIRTPNGYLLEDLDSTNGTLVNGRQVAKHALSTGDIITIGRNTLRFEVSAQADEPAPEVISLASPPSVAAVTEAKIFSGKLKVLTGSNAGRELDLVKIITTLGKPGLQVVAITRQFDGFHIAHTGGTADGNGIKPKLNGAEFGADPLMLHSGDELEIVGTRMQFVQT